VFLSLHLFLLLLQVLFEEQRQQLCSMLLLHFSQQVLPLDFVVEQARLTNQDLEVP
jgi:hypothetical protein